MEHVEVTKRKMSGELVVQVSIHGGMLYVAIPKRIAEFHNIRIGDVLRVQLIELQRTRGTKEEEQIEEGELEG